MYAFDSAHEKMYESPAAPMSNNATDPVELNVFAAPK